MNGYWKRVTFAFRCFFSILVHGDIPNDVIRNRADPGAAEQPAASVPSVSHLKEVQRPAPEEFDRVVQMLALLQRDGRLIDFLEENISAYPDAQLGAGCRTIHESCRQVLDHYVTLEPIMNSEEGQSVTVAASIDPAAIKLIGNVTGDPPIRGVLRHKGWRVKQVNLPRLPQGPGRMVIAPAEIEIP
jgi:hypothetical protein